MTELEKRIQRFRTNRPKGARRLCLALRAITEARAPEDRVQGYPVFPELEDVLDNIPTVSSVGEALLNAEAKSLDVRDLWRAMDDGLNWGIAKRMLRNAKRDFQNNSALSFKEHLANNIANPARAHERADRGQSKKRRSRRALGSMPSITVPQPASDGSTANHPRTAPRLAQVQQQLVEAAQAPGGAEDMELKIYFNITANLAQRHRTTGATTQPVTVSDAAEEAGTTPAKPAESEAKTRTRRLGSGQQARAGRVRTKQSAKRKAGKRKQLTHDPDTGHKLPPLHLRIARALGDRTVDIPTAITLLKAFNKKWVPRSKNLPRYFSLAMSTHEEVFEHLHRGLYRVRPSWFTENAPRVVESAAAA